MKPPDSEPLVLWVSTSWPAVHHLIPPERALWGPDTIPETPVDEPEVCTTPLPAIVCECGRYLIASRP